MPLTPDPYARGNEIGKPWLVRSIFGDEDCKFRIEEVLTIFKTFLAKGNTASKEDADKVIGAANFLTMFIEENPQCAQYLSDDNANMLEEVLDLATKLGYTGGRRKASPKYKRTRRRKSKSKRTRRR